MLFRSELMENDHLWTNLYAPYKMTRGYFDNVGGRTGTRYEHFEKGRYCVVDSFAFVYSGRVGVEQLARLNPVPFMLPVSGSKSQSKRLI